MAQDNTQQGNLQGSSSTPLTPIQDGQGNVKSWSDLSHSEQQRYGSQENYSKVIERFNTQGSGSSTQKGGMSGGSSGGGSI